MSFKEYIQTIVGKIEKQAGQWLWAPLPKAPEMNIRYPPRPVPLKNIIRRGFPFMVMMAFGFGGAINEDTFKISWMLYDTYLFVLLIATCAYFGAVIMEEGKLYEIFAYIGVFLQSWLLYAVVFGYSNIKDADTYERLMVVLTFVLLLYRIFF